MRERLPWLDTAKGLGILLVVLGHMERGLVSAGILTDPYWTTFDFTLYTFHMPLFMLLSGFNVPGSLNRGRDRFVRSKIVTVLYPYFIWSVIQKSALILLSSYTNSGTSSPNFLSILYQPEPPFWFLYALFFYLLVSTVLSVRTMLILAVLLFPLGEFFPRNDFAHQLPHFFLFFALGVFAGGKGENRARRMGNGAAQVSLLVFAVTAGLGLRLGSDAYNSVLMLPAAISGIFCMIWISQKVENFRWLVWLGTMTLPIYVMHILAGAGARIFVTKIVHVELPGVVVLALCFGIAVVAPLVAFKVLERLRLLPLLGLAVGPRGSRFISDGSVRPAKS